MKGLTSELNRYTQGFEVVEMSRQSNQVHLVETLISWRQDAGKSCELRDIVNLNQLTQWGNLAVGMLSDEVCFSSERSIRRWLDRDRRVTYLIKGYNWIPTVQPYPGPQFTLNADQTVRRRRPSN